MIVFTSTWTRPKKVASAINNRKFGHSLGGTWTQTLNRIMSSKDSHAKKMHPSRVKPNKTDVLSGTSTILLKDIITANYQDFINESICGRNDDSIMTDALKATINGILGPDKINGATEWRSRFDKQTVTNFNEFREEGGFK